MTGLPPDSLMALLRAYHSLDVEQQRAVAALFEKGYAGGTKRREEQFQPETVMAVTHNNPALIADTLAPLFGRPVSLRMTRSGEARPGAGGYNQNYGGAITVGRDAQNPVGADIFGRPRTKALFENEKVLIHEFAHNRTSRNGMLLRRGWVKNLGVDPATYRFGDRDEEAFAQDVTKVVQFLRSSAQLDDARVRGSAIIQGTSTRRRTNAQHFLLMRMLNMPPFNNHPKRTLIRQLLKRDK